MGCLLGVPAIAGCGLPGLGLRTVVLGAVVVTGWDAQPCCDGAGLGCSVQMQSLCSLPIVRYQEPQEEDGLEDMTQLE